MQCPSCGLQIDQQNLDRCPRCGYALTPTTGAYGQGGSQAPGYGNPPQSGEPGATGGYAPPQPPANPYGSYGDYGSYGGSGDAAPPSGYGASSQQGPSAPYGPYTIWARAIRTTSSTQWLWAAVIWPARAAEWLRPTLWPACAAGLSDSARLSATGLPTGPIRAATAA